MANKGTNPARQKEIKAFIEKWTGKGDEKQDSHSFWIGLFGIISGLAHPEDHLQFEKRVKIESAKTKDAKKTTVFIDCYIPSTKVIVEQKSIGIDLEAKEQQSDGNFYSPYGQAKRYNDNLPESERAKYIIASNFAEIWVYDLAAPDPSAPKNKIPLADLAAKIHHLQFIADPARAALDTQIKISLDAGKHVDKIYTALAKEYEHPDSEKARRSLNILCVRLIFCLYAEDAGVFDDTHGQFSRFVESVPPAFLRQAIIDLFQTLDTPTDRRPYHIDDSLKDFPYVNGGLFAEENIEIPRFTEEIKKTLLEAGKFDWAGINPTIFGAVFESTLNPETRRAGGMHYTSVENINKVIKPLFLDEINAECDEIIGSKDGAKKKRQRLEELRRKIGALTFLDPACGSGNFLTQSYISLREIENRILKELMPAKAAAPSEQFYLGDGFDPILVNIGQFYGIEVNDFAVKVAKTALWIAELQTMKETEAILGRGIDSLPLKNYANIIEANALAVDWNIVVDREKLNYIMGNPPFVGMKYQNAAQKSEMKKVFGGMKSYGSLDYVSSWYYKASEFIKNTNIIAAFVSTNSITQGEQVSILWGNLLFDKGMEIIFAHRTFTWDSESTDKAAVHCVIIGFCANSNSIARNKLLCDGRIWRNVRHINPYLVEADDILITARTKPLCGVPKIIAGNKPVDGDFLKINAEDYADFISREPAAQKWIKKLIGGYEFINNRERYVLWLVGISPHELKNLPLVRDRVHKVREARLAMIDEGARKLADTPTTFRDTLNPDNYIVIPIVSSENRRYIPIGFLDKSTIPTNQVQIIPDASLYHFGILTSSVHMAWTRAVAGRLKSDYRYTGKIVYNNFPWADATDEQKKEIEKTAQGILDARALYPDSSLADLYDETAMPKELRAAHKANDKAVLKAYGFPLDITEPEITAALMKLYQKLAGK